MRLAVISDIHGNLPALERAFDFIEKLKIDGIIWCGDYITDILLSPEVLEFIRLKNEKYKHWIVKGNREDYIIDYHHGISFDGVDVTGSLLLTYKSLSKSDIKYISSLPDEVVVDISGCPQIYVRHKLNNKVQNYKYHVFGHVHKQCLFIKDGCKFINPGSIGLCFSEAPGLEFALMDLVDGEWSTHFYHMSYNLEYVIKFIRNSGLSTCRVHWSDVIIKTLETGHDYIDDYINNARRVAKKNGIDGEYLPNISDKIWDYVFNNLDKIVKKSNKS